MSFLEKRDSARHQISSLITILFLAGNCIGQTPAYEWTKQFGGSEMDFIFELAIDKEGFLYTSGEFRDTANIGGETIISVGAFQADADAFISKLDTLGNVIWNFHFGGNGSQRVTGIDTDDSCNVYITGMFAQSTLIGNITLIPSSGIQWDFYLAKLDSSGNLQWAISEAPTSESNQTRDLVVDSFGDIIVVGDYAGSQLIGNSFLNNEGQTDIFIAKYNSLGVPLWATTAGSIKSDYGYGISTDDQDNIYICGRFGDQDIHASFDNINVTPLGGADAFVAKYDSYGNALWVRQSGGNWNFSASGGGDEAESVCVYGNSVYITGTFFGTAYFGSDSIVGYQTLGHNSVFIAKYDLLGNVLWVTSDGGTSYDAPQDITTDLNGDVYTSGYFTGNAQYGDSMMINPGWEHLIAVKYDSNGNHRWTKMAGLPNQYNGTRGNAIRVYNDRVYIGGICSDSSNYDNQTYYSFGHSDGMVTCINQNLFIDNPDDFENQVTSFSLYPNPTQNQISIDLYVGTSKDLQIDITDYRGRIIANKQAVSSGVYNFNTNQYSVGTYFIRVYNANVSLVKKFVII